MFFLRLAEIWRRLFCTRYRRKTWWRSTCLAKVVGIGEMPLFFGNDKTCCATRPQSQKPKNAKKRQYFFASKTAKKVHFFRPIKKVQKTYGFCTFCEFDCVFTVDFWPQKMAKTRGFCAFFQREKPVISIQNRRGHISNKVETPICINDIW